MNELLQKTGQFIKNMLANMSTAQLFGLTLLVLLLAVSLVWLVSWGQAGGMVELVSIAESADSKLAVKQKLDQQNVRYEIRDGGAIYVPREQKDALLIDLAGEGVFSDKAMVDWLFNQTDLTSTQDIRDKRFLITLQRSAEKKFSALDGVKSASVTITPASERKTLGFQGDDAKASVLLTLKPNKTMGKQTILGIANVLASSVSGLKARNVSVMDTNGRLYKVPDVENEAGIAQDKDEVEAQEEERLAGKVKDLLAKFGEVYVQARVNKDFSTVKEKKIERSAPIDLSDKESNRTSTGSGGQVGGAPDLAKGATTVTGGGSTSKTERESEVSSVPSKEVTTDTYRPPGDIKDATISVVIPKNAEVKLPPDEDIRKLIAGVVGIKPSEANEKVNIALVEIPKIISPAVVESIPLTDRVSGYAEKYGGQVALGFFALFSLFMIYRVVKQAMPPKDLYTEIARAREIVGETPLAGGTAGAAAPLTGADRINKMRTGVREAVVRNPRSVANVLKRWVMSR